MKFTLGLRKFELKNLILSTIEGLIENKFITGGSCLREANEIFTKLSVSAHC